VGFDKIEQGSGLNFWIYIQGCILF